MAPAPIPPLLILQARAEARAILYCHQHYDTIEAALEPLFAYAVDAGIVDQLGEADTKAMIEAPFVAALAPAKERTDGK